MSASRSRRGTAPAPAPTRFDVDAFLRTFDQFDARLVAAGFPATSPWWRSQIEAFLRSGEARWILRVGRRGGKSTTLSRLGVVWALAGPWSIARGDTPTVAILSVDREEASRRLDTIEAVLGALGVGCTRAGETLALDARGVVFRVETRSKNAVGFTSVMVLADECSRWESREDKADPASEVIASIAPTLAGMHHCFMVLASSPWSEVDYHAKAFDDARDAGPGAGKGFASAAPTWIARPDFTEEHTRTLEPDPRAWSREYAAIPGSTISGAFDAADVNRAFERGSDAAIALANEEVTALETVIAIDASSMRPGSDTFAIAVIRLLESGYHVDSVHAVPEGATFTAAIQHVVDIAREHGARRVILDQHQDAGLDAAFTALGLGVDRIVLGAKSKPQAIATLRRLLRDDRLTLPAEASPWLPDVPAGRDRLRIELLTLKAKLLADGTERVPSNGIDFASTLITFAAAIDAGFVAGDAIELPDFSGPAALQAMALPGLSHFADPALALIFTPDEHADEREAAAARESAERLARAKEQGANFWARYQAAAEARATASAPDEDEDEDTPDEDTDTPADEDGD